MIVEFAGLPGSGKTTLHARAVESLSQQAHPVAFSDGGSVGHALHKAAGVAVYRHCFRIGVTTVLRSPRSWQHRVFAIRSLATTLAAHHRQKQEPSHHVRLLQEGVVQRAFMLFIDPDSEVDEQRLSAYAQAVPLPDMLVFVRITPETATRRHLAKSERPRLDMKQNRLLRTTAPALLATFTRGTAVLEQVTEVLQRRSRGRMGVLTVDADDFAAADVQWRSRILPALLERVTTTTNP